MLKDVVEVRVMEGYCLHIRFEDGAEGDIDLSKYVRFRGVFEPLADPAYFRRVRVDSDLGTITWPNGADLDPDVLYSRITGSPIGFESEDARAQR
jgi:Protein of unknown function (DUF2442)